jgi:AcrR family transcriptional regulator
MPGRRPGRRPGHSDTRQAILDAAREAFADNAYSVASLRDIARRADVDPALVHHYFGSKRQLFDAVVATPWRQVKTQLQDIVDRDPNAEQLLRTFLSACEDPETGPAILAVTRDILDSTARTQHHLPAESGDPCAPPKPQPVVPPRRSRGAPTSSEQLRPDLSARRCLLAGDLLGLVIARYVLRLQPLADAPQQWVVGALAPGVRDHLNAAGDRWPSPESR